jgi:hypothetical protein
MLSSFASTSVSNFYAEINQALVLLPGLVRSKVPNGRNQPPSWAAPRLEVEGGPRGGIRIRRLDQCSVRPLGSRLEG